MKVFQCDCCKKIIEDPFEVNFREYYLAAEYTLGAYFPVNSRKREKTDLCVDCYKNLHQVMKIKDSADVLSQFIEILKSKYLQHHVLSKDFIAITVAELDTLFKLFRGIK